MARDYEYNVIFKYNLLDILTEKLLLKKYVFCKMLIFAQARKNHAR